MNWDSSPQRTGCQIGKFTLLSIMLIKILTVFLCAHLKCQCAYNYKISLKLKITKTLKK